MSGRIMAGQNHSDGLGRGTPPSGRLHRRFRVRPGGMILPRHDSAMPSLRKVRLMLMAHRPYLTFSSLKSEISNLKYPSPSTPQRLT